MLGNFGVKLLVVLVWFGVRFRFRFGVRVRVRYRVRVRVKLEIGGRVIG